MFRIVFVILAMLTLAACTATERGAVAGAGIGAGGAALLGGSGAQIVGAGAAGGVIGALIGNSRDRAGYCRYQRRDGSIYEARCR